MTQTTTIYPHIARSSNGFEVACWGADITSAHAWATKRHPGERFVLVRLATEPLVRPRPSLVSRVLDRWFP